MAVDDQLESVKMNISQKQLKIALDCAFVDHPFDCQRIGRVASDKMNLDVGIIDADTIWKWWSGIHDIVWLELEEDDEIIKAIERFVVNSKM